MKKPNWLPDWRDANQYPPKDNTKPAKWAWEFLRRNVEYQADYERYVRPFLNESGSINNDAAYAFEIKEKQRIIRFRKTPEILGPINRFRKKYGIASPQPPEENSYHPFFEARIIKLIDSNVSYPRLQHYLRSNPSTLFYAFRLDLPIEPQIERAKSYLNAKAKNDNIDQKRNRPDDYQDMLRILDATSEGVLHKDIAAVLYPNHSSGHYDDGRKKVSDKLKRANLLRDKEFSYIAMY